MPMKAWGSMKITLTPPPMNGLMMVTVGPMIWAPITMGQIMMALITTDQATMTVTGMMARIMMAQAAVTDRRKHGADAYKMRGATKIAGTMRDRFSIFLLLGVQLICAGFFLFNIITSLIGVSFTPISWALFELIEIGAAVGLVLGVFVSFSLLRKSAKAQAKAEDSLRLASGAFAELIDERFAEWKLTPAERDVALMCIKGLTIAEITQIRSTSDGTVKAQTNAIYRKAQVNGRAQLMSLFIDDLMGEPLTTVADK